MNNIAITLIRLLGVLILSFFLLYLNFVLETLLKILSMDKPILIIPLLLYFIFPVIISAFLFLEPEKIAKILKIPEPNDNNITYKIVDILGISIILLGLYFCINAFLLLFSEIIMILVKSYTVNDLYLDSTAIGYIAGHLFKIIIGVILVLKGMRLANFIVNNE